jgi:DNA-directed RNA polymerase subunit RPC12/RpoP
MSGHSYDSKCLNCDNDLNSYIDNKPIDTVSHQCFYCGYTIFTQETYLNLEELNEYRASLDVEPLKELPEQKLNLL